jgi:hypothetical protein
VWVNRIGKLSTSQKEERGKRKEERGKRNKGRNGRRAV